MTSHVSLLEAAELSYAAYMQSYVPNGWTFVNRQTSPKDENAFSVYAKQSIIASETEPKGYLALSFKGSDNYSNFKSDLLDNGADAWNEIKNSATEKYLQLLKATTTAGNEYYGYEIITTGHSLGGAMAQSLACINNLDCYEQNSLPLIMTDQEVVASFSSYSHSSINVYVSGDPATLWYSSVQGQSYLGTMAKLSSTYALQEIFGSALAATTGGLLGTAVVLNSMYRAHSILTVIDLLKSGAEPVIDGGSSAQVDPASLEHALQQMPPDKTEMTPDGTSTITTTNPDWRIDSSMQDGTQLNVTHDRNESVTLSSSHGTGANAPIDTITIDRYDDSHKLIEHKVQVLGDDGSWTEKNYDPFSNELVYSTWVKPDGSRGFDLNHGVKALIADFDNIVGDTVSPVAVAEATLIEKYVPLLYMKSPGIVAPRIYTHSPWAIDKPIHVNVAADGSSIISGEFFDEYNNLTIEVKMCLNPNGKMSFYSGPFLLYRQADGGVSFNENEWWADLCIGDNNRDIIEYLKSAVYPVFGVNQALSISLTPGFDINSPELFRYHYIMMRYHGYRDGWPISDDTDVGSSATDENGESNSNSLTYYAFEKSNEFMEISRQDPSINGAVLKFGPGIEQKDITVHMVDGALFLHFNGEDRIKINGMLDSNTDGILRAEFSDGTIWTHEQIQKAVATGTAGDDILYGSLNSETLDGKGGNDYISGNGGSDTYILGHDYGDLTINTGNQPWEEQAAGELIINQAKPENIWLRHSGDDLKIYIMGSSAAATVEGWYNSLGNRLYYLEVTNTDSKPLYLNGKLESLVKTMEAYEQAHPGFDPTANDAIFDEALNAEISYSWRTSYWNM